jgi:hypothetical protein
VTRGRQRLRRHFSAAAAELDALLGDPEQVQLGVKTPETPIRDEANDPARRELAVILG